MPTTHVNDVTQDWAIILYAILIGKLVDVGKLLAHWMVHGSHMKGMVSLYFPTIVTFLCVVARVKWDKNEAMGP